MRLPKQYRFQDDSVLIKRVGNAAVLLPPEIASYDLAAALRYADVRAELARRGKPIDPLDTQIASHALSLGVTLVTGNEREFRRVTALTVENWAQARRGSPLGKRDQYAAG